MPTVAVKPMRVPNDWLGWVRQGLTSHSTYFRSFRRRWGGCGISQDCSHSQSPTVCAVLSSVCATTVVYYLKGIVSVCPARTVRFSGDTPLLVRLQPTNYQAERRSSAAHLLARWEDERTTACTRRRSICYPYSRHPLQAQAPLNLSVMACHSLERIQVGPLFLFENLIS